MQRLVTLFTSVPVACPDLPRPCTCRLRVLRGAGFQAPQIKGRSGGDASATADGFNGADAG